jgi:hypothetical protein
MSTKVEALERIVMGRKGWAACRKDIACSAHLLLGAALSALPCFPAAPAAHFAGNNSGASDVWLSSLQSGRPEEKSSLDCFIWKEAAQKKFLALMASAVMAQPQI